LIKVNAPERDIAAIRRRGPAASIHFHIDAPPDKIPQADTITSPIAQAMAGIAAADRKITPEQADKILPQHVKGYDEPERTNEYRAPDGEFTSPAKEASLAERNAAVKAELAAERELKQEEGCYQAMEAIGITWAPKAFFIAIGAGRGDHDDCCSHRLFADRTPIKPIHLPRRHHRQEALATILAALALVMLVACTGCAEQPSDYGAANDAARSTCQAQGAVPVTHYSHGGWTTDCSESLPE
jgi:hypothetical protein